MESIYQDYLALLSKGLTRDQALQELKTYLHPITMARFEKYLKQRPPKAGT